MKILLRIFLSLISILLIIILFISMIVFHNRRVGKATYIANYTIFINAGSSMYPTIKKGSILIIKKADNYFKNDIISFVNDEQIITTHRIINYDINDSFITKGDNNNFIDGYRVTKEDIYGKLVWQIGNYNKILKFSYIFLFATLVPFIIFYIFKKRP